MTRRACQCGPREGCTACRLPAPRCYACDAPATGMRERRLAGLAPYLAPACERHSNPLDTRAAVINGAPSMPPGAAARSLLWEARIHFDSSRRVMVDAARHYRDGSPAVARFDVRDSIRMMDGACAAYALYALATLLSE